MSLIIVGREATLKKKVASVKLIKEMLDQFRLRSGGSAVINGPSSLQRCNFKQNVKNSVLIGNTIGTLFSLTPRGFFNN